MTRRCRYWPVTEPGTRWPFVRDDHPFAGTASPAVVFRFSGDRGREHPAEDLKDRQGILRAGTYAGYNHSTIRSISSGRSPSHRAGAICGGRSSSWPTSKAASATAGQPRISPIAFEAVKWTDPSQGGHCPDDVTWGPRLAASLVSISSSDSGALVARSGGARTDPHHARRNFLGLRCLGRELHGALPMGLAAHVPGEVWPFLGAAGRPPGSPNPPCRWIWSYLVRVSAGRTVGVRRSAPTPARALAATNNGMR